MKKKLFLVLALVFVITSLVTVLQSRPAIVNRTSTDPQVGDKCRYNAGYDDCHWTFSGPVCGQVDWDPWNGYHFDFY